MRSKYTPQQRANVFWSKVAITANDDLCWEWKAGKRSKYGSFGSGSSHRIAWELANGKIPDGLWVLHKCDNPLCCNPKHLFLGTAKNNSDDMVNKDRQAIGEKNGFRKLTDAQVIEIREKYVKGRITQKEIAAEYGVTYSTVSLVVNNKSWKHIKEINE